MPAGSSRNLRYSIARVVTSGFCGKRDDGRAHAQDHGRVDLAVRVGRGVGTLRVKPRRLQVLDCHRNHRRLLHKGA
eukprot:349872-Chlamydomonas_euryale.AAC.3